VFLKNLNFKKLIFFIFLDRFDILILKIKKFIILKSNCNLRVLKKDNTHLETVWERDANRVPKKFKNFFY